MTNDNMDTKWIYCGIFFDDDNKQKILKHAKNLCYKHEIKFPEDWVVYCDHMTLVYNNGHLEEQVFAEQFENMIGQEQKLRCIGIGKSDKAIAMMDFFKSEMEYEESAPRGTQSSQYKDAVDLYTKARDAYQLF